MRSTRSKKSVNALTIKQEPPHVYSSSLHRWLDDHASAYHTPSFTGDDPIIVPHRFRRRQDIEIAGLFTAIMAWGQRPTIIRKAGELMDLMQGAPYEFILGHKPADLKRLLHFRHRTLQPEDVLFLIHALRGHYRSHDTLEAAFLAGLQPGDVTMEGGLNAFSEIIFDRPEALQRTRKHIPAPVRKSSCKRLNMFLRWMVRQDDRGVDFGLWTSIRPDMLVIPLDVHVGRVARQLGLLRRAQDDWQAAMELTSALKVYDPKDPVRYDFALFGAGIAAAGRRVRGGFP